MKYIIFENSLGLEVPVVFSEFTKHSEVVLSEGASAGYHSAERISAGFCYIDKNGKWHVYGRSTSLDLNSREEDAKILNDLLQP